VSTSVKIKIHYYRKIASEFPKGIRHIPQFLFSLRTGQSVWRKLFEKYKEYGISLMD